MTHSVTLNLVLLVSRLFLGAMIFAHGYRKAFVGARLAGTAKFFDSIGMRPAGLNAALAAFTEMGAGALLVVGLLTTPAAGALMALMVVAIVTVHGKNGFFVFNAGQGIEYCLAVAVMSLVQGTFGGGRFSLDHLLRHHQPVRFMERPSHAIAITLVIGLVGPLLQLAATFRPSRPD